VSLKPLECQDASRLSEGCKPLEYQDSSHLSGVLKPLELNHPLTILKPLKEDNDEEKIAAKLRMLSHLYETTIGAITPLMADLLRNAAIDYPEEWFEPAFEVAVKNNVRRWIYVETILDGWKRNGFGWKPVSTAPTRSQQIFARASKSAGGKKDPTSLLLEYINNGG
jgi:DnaD/phage-associated family protein